VISHEGTILILLFDKMKKSEILGLLIGLFCIAGLVGYFAVTTKISKAEREADRARDALVVSEQRVEEIKEELALSRQREAELTTKLNELEELERKRELAERERYKDDIEWVRQQDSLDIYLRFAEKFPNHPEIDAINKRIIDLEVQKIAAGEHGVMPPAQPIAVGGTTTEVEIENKTGYVLTVRYSGVDSKRITIPIGATQTVTLKPGAYQVAASVSAAHVTNYYGRDTMQGGRYSSSFFIRTTTTR